LDSAYQTRLRIKPSSKAVTRPGLVTAVGWLLILQASGFFIFGLLHLLTLSPAWLRLPTSQFNLGLLGHFSLGVMFIPLGLLGLTAAIGMFYLRRSAWLIALLVQGLSLFMALIIYLEERSPYSYLVMGTSSFLVIYLHYSDIQMIFRSRMGGEE
jgi:hypothetical protein